LCALKKQSSIRDSPLKSATKKYVRKICGEKHTRKEKHLKKTSKKNIQKHMKKNMQENT